ncbi:uncharacterized protein VNE69_09182 [Vairimorpha necatrix]|uniref:Uncharacterized protein n=1 Tax=Vairimorpha necatrix TaxID=6039 RepID=A0AAX4JF43_9MICR
MDADILYKINQLLLDPTSSKILDLFDKDGYIRLNMVYISPIHLPLFRNHLLKYGLVEMYLTNQGLGFTFRNFHLNFFGSIYITQGNNKIWSIEIIFDPTIDDNVGIPVMNEIEHYLQGCDALFFMTYFVDIDKEILNRSLADSVDFMYKRNINRKKHF